MFLISAASVMRNFASMRAARSPSLSNSILTRPLSHFSRTHLFRDDAARDGIEHAIEKVDGFRAGISSADFEGLVDDYGKGCGPEAEQFGHGHAKEIAIDCGHAIEAPVL